MENNTFDWSGFKWQTRQPWGLYHPNAEHTWFDNKAVSIDDNNKLVLKTHINPRVFKKDDANEIKRDIGIGLVSSINSFDHGYFEIEGKLPKNPGMWCAFWMYADGSWPPEIDIFEAYSNDKSSYFDFMWKNKPIKRWSFSDLFRVWNIETRVHYLDEDDERTATAPKRGWMGYKNPVNNYIKYGLLWTKKNLKFYYNEKLVRVINDEQIMSRINKHKMRVLINTGLKGENKIENAKNEPKFRVKYFKYEKL